jgi:hypothetical protein
MFGKLKFIPLILISLFTLSFAVQVPLSSSSYDYRFRISAAGDMWLYNGIVDGVSEHCQYTQIENNAYAQPSFNESFKKDSFYAQSDPASKSPNGYFSNPATLYKFLGSETYNGSVSFKHETYSWAKKPNSIQKICVQCNTKAGEYFDSTTGLCVNKCEDITNQNDRIDCMCKRAGKIGYNGSFSTMNIGGDGSMVCSYGCKSTKDDPEAKPNGDGTMFNVSYDIKDIDPNANGVCFTDDIYAPNAMPGPSPKPDKPDNNNTKPGGGSKPDKPDTNNTKPDKPNQGGGGHPGGGSNPGNNNGTKPGNDNGTKPGKDDNQGKFDPKDFDDGGLDKAREGLYDSIKNHLENGISKFDGVRDGIDQFIKNVQGKGFAKVSPGIKRSCPIKKEIQLPDGKARELVVDYCDAVAPASEVSYYVFYIFFLISLFLLFLKLLAISIR